MFRGHVLVVLVILVAMCTGILVDLKDNQGELSLEAMAQQITALGTLVTSLSTQVYTLTSKLDILNTKQDAVISFKAYASKDRTYSLGSTIIFDTIETNIGDGYNATSGVFHVPVSGIYTFTCQIETTSTGVAEFMLYSHGVRETVMTIHQPYDSKTMTAVIHADKGTDIFVKKVYNIRNAPLRASIWTQFSGHLLRAD